MNKKEIVDIVSVKSDLSKKDSALAIETFLETISEALMSGEKVKLAGFGTYEVKKRKAKKGRNLQTKEEIIIPECNVPKFRFSENIKESVK